MKKSEEEKILNIHCLDSKTVRVPERVWFRGFIYEEKVKLPVQFVEIYINYYAQAKKAKKPNATPGNVNIQKALGAEEFKIFQPLIGEYITIKNNRSVAVAEKKKINIETSKKISEYINILMTYSENRVATFISKLCFIQSVLLKDYNDLEIDAATEMPIHG